MISYCFYSRYQHLRETLLKEMLKNHVGEGMWTALSTKEQNERTTQLAVKVKKLRKEGKLDANSASTLPGSGTILPVNMMALMGNSRFGALRLHKEEEKLRGLMKEKGEIVKATIVMYQHYHCYHHCNHRCD